MNATPEGCNTNHPPVGKGKNDCDISRKTRIRDIDVSGLVHSGLVHSGKRRSVHSPITYGTGPHP